MKLIAANCDNIDSLQRRFVPNSRESVMSTLGILGLLDVYETHDYFVLVLDYCQGGELFDVLIDAGHFPEQRVLDYFQQIVHALEFCHNRGICHRDLKPENMLLTEDGRIKIADFGMASLLAPGSFLETSCGSPQYCAPEILLGELYEGCAADIWSLGVVLFAMTTGGLPFNDENLHRLTSKIRSGAFYMPPEVPEDLADLIRSMLVVDPAKRATLKDIKNSNWFNSRLRRSDIYTDEDLTWRRWLHSRMEKPVHDPDSRILRYLADLGLGDIPTIRRRLGKSEKSIEKQFYCQLAEFSPDELHFTEIQNVPLSPTKSSSGGSPNSVSAVHSAFVTATSEDPSNEVASLTNSRGQDRETAGDGRYGVTTMHQLPVAVPVDPSWFPDWTLNLLTDSANGHGVTSMLQMDSHPSRSRSATGVQSR